MSGRPHRAAVAAAVAAFAAFAVLPAGPVHAGSGPVGPPSDPALLDAEPMPLAAASLLLGAARLGERWLAVGERGHVLVSDDGRRWRQSPVPTRSTLTAVCTAGERAWAVGHDGVILASADRGEHWQRQRAAPWQPGRHDDEAGIPLLDVLFLDEHHGFAIGAFSLLLETTDGGVTWTSAFLSELAGAPEDERATMEDPAPAAGAGTPRDADEGPAGVDWGFAPDDLVLEEEDDPHLNAIVRTGSGALLIAGERGTLFRARAPGAPWERLRLPYEGSMFGALAWDGDHVLVFGLRGHVFESHDLGDTWTRVDSGTGASLMGGVALAGGGAVLVGIDGRVVSRTDADAVFEATTHITVDGETPVLAAVEVDGAGGFLLFGERGIDRIGGPP